MDEFTRKVIAQRDEYRAALAALVGADGPEDLAQMEAVIRLAPVPASDKAAMVDAINALQKPVVNP